VRRRKRTLANKVIATQPSASGDSVRKGGRKSVWGTFITNYTLEADRAVPYSELKQEIMKTPLGPKLEQSDKGFYHAISRLDKHKVIKAYRGHTFSPEAFGRFQADLAAGKVRDIKIPNSAHYSPMGVAIEALMKTRPNGAESGHIIWELRKNPEFAATIDKNHTHPYNVLARMVRQQQLIKRGKRYFSPKTETPSGSSEGVSNLFGDGGTSPNRDRGAA
jgi:hypothetical protein